MSPQARKTTQSNEWRWIASFNNEAVLRIHPCSTLHINWSTAKATARDPSCCRCGRCPWSLRQWSRQSFSARTCSNTLRYRWIKASERPLDDVMIQKWRVNVTMVMIIYGQESRDRKTGTHSRTAGPGRMYRKGFKFILSSRQASVLCTVRLIFQVILAYSSTTHLKSKPTHQMNGFQLACHLFQDLQ